MHRRRAGCQTIAGDPGGRGRARGQEMGNLHARRSQADRAVRRRMGATDGVVRRGRDLIDQYGSGWHTGWVRLSADIRRGRGSSYPGHRVGGRRDAGPFV